ncbi:MAG: TetR/AcrR family transcriptional regulator [Deltaproteobacteria bacterium]|nr:TetR/AcrR family transcriptional regulator [Deltaproteobacteria bacterium]
MVVAADTPVRERRRAEILAAAGRLFAARGVRETTVRQIAEEVGVLAGSLYYYFDTKEGILDALMRPYVDALLERYRRCAAREGDARSKLQWLVEASLLALLEHPDENAILQAELNRSFREEHYLYLRDAVAEIERIYIEVIEAGIAAGRIRSDIEARFLFRTLMDIVKGTPYWFDPETHRVPELMAGWWRVVGEGVFPSR